ncbi:MAG: GNAT family protein [Bryobacteraceae bacterium]|jgi:ribosomal-protein-serine acetyltransferase
MNAESDLFRRTVAPGIEIKLLEPRDAEAVFAAADRDRAYLREWLPWVDRTHSAEDVRYFIEEVVGPQWADNRGPQCGIWVDGSLAGSVGCHPIDWANRACSVGYWVESSRQGQGLVTRSVVALLDYLFEEMRLHRVVIQCGVGNHRSCAIPERLGFTREGVLRQAERVGARWVDLATWSMLEDEWRQAAQAAGLRTGRPLPGKR